MRRVLGDSRLQVPDFFRGEVPVHRDAELNDHTIGHGGL